MLPLLCQQSTSRALSLSELVWTGDLGWHILVDGQSDTQYVSTQFKKKKK